MDAPYPFLPDDLSAPDPLTIPGRVVRPDPLQRAVWRADEVGAQGGATVATGHRLLDAALPGNGWPCGAAVEILPSQPALAEWRLVAPALGGLSRAGQHLCLVGPPRLPHLPGLIHAGIDERRVVWIQADTPAERLWSTEQLVKAAVPCAVVAWLPHARPEQIRRLQVCASQAADILLFLVRPPMVAHEASAAPLRLIITVDMDWTVHVNVLKRRGAPLSNTLRLDSVPGGLSSVLTPRAAMPGRLPDLPNTASGTNRAVGRPAHRQPVHAGR